MSNSNELEAIERAARGVPAPGMGGPTRRGSSMFAPGAPSGNHSDTNLLVDFPTGGGGGGNRIAGGEIDLSDDDEDFEIAVMRPGGPAAAPAPPIPREGGGPRRGSVVMQPIAMSGLAGLEDFDDDDDDDMIIQGGKPGGSGAGLGGLPGNPAPGNPGIPGLPGNPPPGNPPSTLGGVANPTGGPGHRPMVGGFAAAAYEAARAYHYQRQGMATENRGGRKPPPSI